MDIFKSLGIEFPVVIAQSVAFLLLLGLLLKFLYRPVEMMLSLRKEQIANSLTAADEQRQQAESLRMEYEGHLANIADEARAKMDQAMKDAEVTRQRMLEAAKSEIHELHERHFAQLTLDREQLRRDLRSEMSDIAVNAATTALRTQLPSTLQSSIIDNVIKELEKPSKTIN
jgi:F-type H+-transporting ATPase subunit b